MLASTSCGHREKEAAPFSQCALNPDAPAMELYDPFGNGQTQPRALLHSAGGRRHLRELLEYGGLLFAWYADARIAYTTTDLAVIRFGAYLHSATHRSKLDGIAQEVVQDLLESSSIPVRCERGRRVAAEIDV